METITSLPDRYVRLRDGRRLTYAEYGDPQGKPVFFFHGTPGSRLFHHPDVSVAASAGARIIAVDRPGFGRSDFKPGRTLLDWPNDIVQLADALNMQHFAVMGFSGGGPYAAVCASSIPDRLTAAGLVSSIAPLDNPQMTAGMQGMTHMFFSLERHLPPLARLGCWLMCTTWRHNPDLYFRSQINGFRDSEEARAVLPKMKDMLTADLLEAVRTGSRGITWDLELLTRPWGFHLHVITADVFLWHGEIDTQAPLIMGKRLSSAIPHCRATFFPGEGHWAIHRHWQEILTALVEAEAVPHSEPQSATIPIITQDSNSGSEKVGSLECPDITIVDIPADSSQGLQPVREVPETIQTEATEATVSAEPRRKSKGAKSASKNKAKHRCSTATADKSAKASPEPEPVQEAPKPVSKKAASRASAAALHSPIGVSEKVRPAAEKAKSAGRASKRSAMATADSRTVDSSGSKRPTDKAKASAKEPAKPRAMAIELPSASTPKQAREPAPEPTEPIPKKPPRKAAKEAVLV